MGISVFASYKRCFWKVIGVIYEHRLKHHLNNNMNFIIKRINIFLELIKPLFGAACESKGVPFTSKLSSLFQLYGLRKLALKQSTSITKSIDGITKRVTIKDRPIYWPSSAPVNRLVDMYFEVFHNNCHRFDTCSTKLLANDVVIDAGCCEGYFAMLALEKGASKVYCFEPGRTIGSCLKQTFSNEIDNGHIEIVPMLLGNINCYFKFLEDPDDPTTGRLLPETVDMEVMNTYPVEMTTLDFFRTSRCLDKVDFIKIDVEGAEPEVIKGAKDIIKHFAPRIAVAVYHAPHHSQQLQEIILSINGAYQFQLKGLVDLNGIVRPVMLHCHVP